MYHTLEKLDLQYPKVTEAKKVELQEVRQVLMAEK